MNTRASFVVKNNLAELERLMGGVSAWCQRNSISSETAYEVNLVVDEVVSNIIRHGYQDDKEHSIQFDVALEDGELVMRVADDGIHFNPLIIPAPDTSRPMEERHPGGLGIYLVKKLTHDIQYRRENSINILSMRKQTKLVS
jgi:anti-sigma regulatory factor (Ser/Thr protein kinase)